MAQLTSADYRKLRDTAYTIPHVKLQMKALPGGLPNEAKLLDMFQDIEDNAVSNFATQKALIEASLGVTVSNQTAQRILATYYLWKIEQLLG